VFAILVPDGQNRPGQDPAICRNRRVNTGGVLKDWQRGNSEMVNGGTLTLFKELSLYKAYVTY